MCGLAGFYPKKGKKVNLKNLLLLGILNETRGTDSCGISIGNQRFTGVKELSTARDFINATKDELNEVTLLNKPCIFHTRKSTVGAHNEDNAHPFIYEGLSENTKYFAAAHNGVIRNMQELKRLYIKNEVEDCEKYLHIDSHYLIMSLGLNIENNEKHKEILEKYEGNAALLYYNDDTYNVWKGGCNNTEERPMYYIETPEGWYFCSIDSSLNIIFDFKYKIVKVDNNQLLTFEKGLLKSKKIISRSLITTLVPHNHNKNYYAEYEERWQNRKTANVTPMYSVNDNPYISITYSYEKQGYIDMLTNKILNGLYYTFTPITNNQQIYSIQKTKQYCIHPVCFAQGVLITDFKLWTYLNKKFNVKHYKNLDLFLRGEIDIIGKLLIDVLPMRENNKELIMLIFKDKDGKIDYISKYDQSTIQLPLKVRNNSLQVKADREKIIIEPNKLYYFNSISK